MNRADKHEIEKNELADKLEAGISAVQPALPVILGAIALLVVGSIGYGLYATSSNSKEAAAWTEYYFNLSGSDADTFLEVADGFPSSSMAGWARLSAGDNYLHKGVEAMYMNRSEGIDMLQSAISTYEESLDAAGSEELRAKALLGLGQAHESLGELDKANEYYQQYVTSPAPPQMIAAVNERLTFLTSASGKDFYDWFSKLDPKPDSPINLSSDLMSPPTMPDMGFGTGGSGEVTSSSDGAPETQPIDPATVPDLDAPAPEGSVDNINDLELPPQEGGEGQGGSEEDTGPASTESEGDS